MKDKLNGNGRMKTNRAVLVERTITANVGSKL